MEEAERIAREEHGSSKIGVISGVGTRNYYRKIGYELEGPYMTKSLLWHQGQWKITQLCKLVDLHYSRIYLFDKKINFRSGLFVQNFFSMMSFRRQRKLSGAVNNFLYGRDYWWFSSVMPQLSLLIYANGRTLPCLIVLITGWRVSSKTWNVLIVFFQ